MWQLRLVSMIASAALFTLPITATGQGTGGAITGTVSDETGAVLPGATVEVRHLSTGSTRTVITDERGKYSVPNAALGSYEIEAALAGFQTVLHQGLAGH
jgi:hypothetical protein